MTRTTKLLLFLTLVLITIAIGQSVWIYQQHQQMKLLQVTGHSILQGNIVETLNEIDRFTKTKDRAALEHLYVRLSLLEREAQRMVELTHSEPTQKHPTTPGGLVDLILKHHVSYEQTAVYLNLVQEKLLAYQDNIAPAVETEENQKAFLQLWRDLFQLAHAKHQEWNLP